MQLSQQKRLELCLLHAEAGAFAEMVLRLPGRPQRPRSRPPGGRAREPREDLGTDSRAGRGAVPRLLRGHGWEAEPGENGDYCAEDY